MGRGGVAQRSAPTMHDETVHEHLRESQSPLSEETRWYLSPLAPLLSLSLSLSLCVMCVGKSGATHQVVLALERCVHPGVQRDVEGACAAGSVTTAAFGWLSERAPCPSFNNFCVVIEPPCTQLPRHGDSMCVCLQRRRSRQAWDLQSRVVCGGGMAAATMQTM
jgi:hypothetical protein